MTVGGIAYHVGGESFFQANLPVAERLVEAVLAALNLGGHERVLDLYCGVGLFTVPIARRARQVVGVETSSLAVADALRNLAPFPHASVLEAPVAQALSQVALGGETWDAVVLDPPRTGAGPEVTAALRELRAPRLVYVSCDPATLARDLRALVDGGYRLRFVQPFDMFPQTHHVEAVAVLDTFLEAPSFQEG